MTSSFREWIDIGVTHPAVAQDLLAALAALAPVAHDIEGEDRTELFDRQRVVAADACQLARSARGCRARTVDPACCAIYGGGRPTSAGFRQPLGRNEDRRQRVDAPRRT